MPKLRELDCDLLRAAEDEPFRDRATNQRLADGVRLAMASAGEG